MVAADDGTNRYVYMPKGADEVADFHVLSFFARKLVMHHTQTHRLVANEGVVLDVKLTHSKARGLAGRVLGVCFGGEGVFESVAFILGVCAGLSFRFRHLKRGGVHSLSRVVLSC